MWVPHVILSLSSSSPPPPFSLSFSLSPSAVCREQAAAGGSWSGGGGTREHEHGERRRAEVVLPRRLPHGQSNSVGTGASHRSDHFDMPLLLLFVCLFVFFKVRRFDHFVRSCSRSLVPPPPLQLPPAAVASAPVHRRSLPANDRRREGGRKREWMRGGRRKGEEDMGPTCQWPPQICMWMTNGSHIYVFNWNAT
jgi:hypothetical protein